ncbi:MAG: hypothetical protein GY769_20030 [bacterium]|nr:hypothetical protein [bacterium]
MTEFGAINSQADIDGGAEVLWAWDGSGVTQLGDGDGTPDGVIGTPTGTIAKSTIATESPVNLDASDAPIVVHSFTGSSGTPTAFYTFNDVPTLPDRFIVEARLGPRQAGNLGLNCTPHLIIGYQDPTHRVSFYRVSTNIRAVTGNGDDGINVGAFIDLTGSVLNTDEGTWMRVTLDLREPDASNDPGMRILANVLPFGAEEQDILASTSAWTAFGGGTSPASSWDAGWRTGGSIKNVGIAFTEHAAAGQGYMGDMRILGFPGVD